MVTVEPPAPRSHFGEFRRPGDESRATVAFARTEGAEPQAAHQASPAEGWLERYGDYLYGFAMVHVRRRETAEDLVQETLLAGLEMRSRFEGHSSERTWLVGILKNKIADHYRRGRRERPFTDAATAREGAEEAAVEALFHPRRGRWLRFPSRWPSSPPETALESRDFWKVFHRCLGKLSPRLAETFVLREVSGLSTAQLRGLLGLSNANVWTQLHRARTLLRDCLERNWFPAVAGRSAHEHRRPRPTHATTEGGASSDGGAEGKLEDRHA